MTTFITKANQGSYQTNVVNTNGLDLLDLEEIVLDAGATISSEKATGIAGSASVSGASILIMGTVLSGGLSSFLFKQAGILAKLGGNKVEIDATGVVFGLSDGILLSDAGGTLGSNFVENRGLVTTTSGIGISAKLSDNSIANLGTVEAVRGIVAGSAGSSSNTVVNSGSIYSSGAGVELYGDGSSLTNSGLIRSSGLQVQPAQAAIILKSSIGETITVLNQGAIESYSGEEGEAVSGDVGSDRIINFGTIRGNIRLGDGNDLYDGKGGTVVGEINMGEGNDSIYGSTFDAAVNLEGGDDLYDGRGGEALGFIYLGAGMDTAYGGSHNDTLDGGGENDWLNGGDGDDTIYLQGGNDKGLGGSGNDVFQYNGLFGSDTIDGGNGIDEVSISSGVDVTINLSSTKLQKTGFWGNIQMSGIENVTSGGFNDLLIGSSVSNKLTSNEGIDTLEGGLGNDVLDGGFNLDFARFTGSKGAKVNLAKTGAQATGYGTDTFISIEGLIGSSGADSFIGDGNTNGFYGNAGNDTCSGGGGDDFFSSGTGNDRLTGGAGADYFTFEAMLNAKTNVDTITDFSHSEDVIELDKAFFKKLTVVGSLSSKHFRLGTAAKDKDDYIVYDKAIGALYYDVDGSGTGAAVKFAQLKKGAVLAYDDFSIIS